MPPPDSTRRQFCETAAAAAVAPLAARVEAAPNPVRVAAIGVGVRGQFLLSRLACVAEGRCAVVCDTDAAQLQRALQVCRGAQGCSDYRRALERKDVEAVIVAAPPHTHFAIARDALQAGKHVFCEPVLVLKPDEISALRRVAESSDRIVQVGFQRRYSEFYQTAKQMAAKGFLGEVTHVYAQHHRNQDWTMRPDEPREKNWRVLREFSHGLVSECAAPQLDLANWIFADTPEFFSGVGGLDWRRDGRDTYDNISLICRYPGGQKLMCSAVTGNRHMPMFGNTRTGAAEVIMGTEGTIEITAGEGDGAPLGLWFYEPNPTRVTTAEDRAEMAKMAGASTTSMTAAARGMPILLARDQFSGEESFLQKELKYTRRWLYSKGLMLPQETRPAAEAQLAHFFECCRTGSRPKARLETGLENAACAILASRALDEGRRVFWSEFEKASG